MERVVERDYGEEEEGYAEEGDDFGDFVVVICVNCMGLHCGFLAGGGTRHFGVGEIGRDGERERFIYWRDLCNWKETSHVRLCYVAVHSVYFSGSCITFHCPRILFSR